MNKNLIGASLVVIGALALVYFYAPKAPDGEVPDGLPEVQGGFKLYRFEEAGFEVAAPEEWFVSGDVVEDGGGGFVISFVSPETRQALEEIFNDPDFVGEGPAIEFFIQYFTDTAAALEGRENLVSRTTIDIDGEEGHLVVEDGLYVADSVYVEHNGHLYILSTHNEAAVDQTILDKIYSSFQFIEES